MTTRRSVSFVTWCLGLLAWSACDAQGDGPPGGGELPRTASLTGPPASSTESAAVHSATARDRQVLEALLPCVLADPTFNRASDASRDLVLVLHERTRGNGFGRVVENLLLHEAGDHPLPQDALDDLKRRNIAPVQDSGSDEVLGVSLRGLGFGPGIELADFSGVWSLPAFREAYPRARAWSHTYLPGYSQDGRRAVVSASVGPSAHGASLSAVLRWSDERWLVEWHRIALYY